MYSSNFGEGQLTLELKLIHIWSYFNIEIWSTGPTCILYKDRNTSLGLTCSKGAHLEMVWVKFWKMLLWRFRCPHCVMKTSPLGVCEGLIMRYEALICHHLGDVFDLIAHIWRWSCWIFGRKGDFEGLLKAICCTRNPSFVELDHLWGLLPLRTCQVA